MDDGLTAFQRAAAAEAEVERRLAQITRALEAAQIPFAVIGNQATSLWIATVDKGAVRNARDTEILVARNDLASASACAISIGLTPNLDTAVTCFVDSKRPQSRNVVRYFIADEKLSEDDILPAPDLASLERPTSQYPVLPLDLHIRWQLIRFRRDDRVDVIDMMGVRLVRPRLADDLPPLLQLRLAEMFDAFAKEREGFLH